LFFLSSILPVVNSIYVEKSTDTLENVLDNGLMDSAWPMFGHDIYHTGRSPYGANGYYLYEKWRIKLADFIYLSSPVIDNNGTIYIGTDDGTLHAINPDGTEKWRFITTQNYESGMTTPSIDKDGTIYVTTRQGYFFAINPNGTEKWRVKLKWFSISSPTIANDGTIFISGDNKFYAIYPNGTIKWDFSTEESIKATSAIDKEGNVYVSSHDGYLYSFYPNNGTLRWKIRIGGHIQCYSSPAIDDNEIIYIGSVGYFYAIYSNGTIKWKLHVGGAYGDPSIGFDGTIYVSSEDFLRAFSPEGVEKWSLMLGTNVKPAIANNSMIYVVGGKTQGWSDKTIMISPIGEEISCLTLEGDKPYDTSSLGDPAIGADGTIYIGSWFECGESDGYLHAINTTFYHRPSIPIVTGPDECSKRVEYNFSARCFHVDGYNVSFFFDWGDGSNSGWTNFVPPGVSINASHTWKTVSDYKIFNIKVKAKDVYGAESDWTTFKVTVPKTKAININLFLQRFFQRFPFFEKILNQII